MKTCPTCGTIYPQDFAVCPRDATKLNEAPTWPVGTLIRNKYRILERLGEGGMGVVYKAMHVQFEEAVAIKVMNAKLIHDGVFRKRFQNEAALARPLHHLNAVRIEDIDTQEDGTPFIVMEYVAGTSLQKIIEQSAPLDVERVLRITKQVTSALAAAHRLGIVHRAIQPKNIIIVDSQEGEAVKVLGFGIVKATMRSGADGPSLSDTAVAIGSPSYVSPEQACGLGSAAQIDGRADLYSLGIVLYQMIAGRLPITGDDAQGILAAHATQLPAPITECCPELPKALADIVMRCLEKSPERRPPNAESLLDEIRDFESNPKLARLTPDISARNDIAARVDSTSTGGSETKPTRAVSDPDVNIPDWGTVEIVNTEHESEGIHYPNSLSRLRPGFFGGILILFVALAGLTFVQRFPEFAANRGDAYFYGKGQAQNYDSAMTWYRRAAERGSTRAQFRLGTMYSEGRGVTKDEGAAASWYVKAANSGVPEAQNNLGLMYANGRGVPKDSTLAFNLFTKAAEQGLTQAQFSLGTQYAAGQGTSKSDAKALVWYLKAAEKGYGPAEFALARMYYEGRGAVKDESKALNWYRKAAEHGIPEAQLNIGIIYSQEGGAHRDPVRGVEWFRKAAEQGLSDAQFNLGLSYGKGRGVQKDYAQAHSWYLKAAEGGNAAAQNNLGVMYSKGEGVPQDMARAVEWFRKAAGQGHGTAQYNLGSMYETGRGVPRNSGLAYDWYRTAARQGNESAAKKLKLIGNPR